MEMKLPKSLIVGIWVVGIGLVAQWSSTIYWDSSSS